MTQSASSDTTERPEIPGVEILEEIGRGAHSAVFHGRLGERECAVKVRRGVAEADGARWRLRYRREAAVLARFSHPGLARIIEAGETPGSGRPYLIMEYVDGTDLAEVLDHRGPLGEARVVEIARTIASALGEVHRYGVIHRDIKPSNILVRSADAALKLIDFGFATRTEPDRASSAVVGTLRYSAPEQTGMLQRPVDGRSDLYSLGVVLYESATGQPPFMAEDPSELVRQHAVDAPTPARQQNADIGPVLSAIIDKLLAKDPDDRYGTCEALLADLDHFDQLEQAYEQGDDLRLGSRNAAPRNRPTTPLFGRHREFNRLESAWLAARSGRGQICWVTGTPGVGSTRLVEELVDRGIAEGAFVFAVHCDELPGTPFGAIRRAGEDFVRFLRSLDDEQRLARMDHIEQASHQYLPMIAQLTSTALDLPEAARQFVAEDSGSPTRFAEAVASFFLHLASVDWPVMFVVDEIHSIDDASLQVIGQVAHRLGDRHFMLACTASEAPDSDSRPAAYFDHVEHLPMTHVRVGPLDEHAVGELIASELGGKGLSERIIRQITSRTQGVPMAVREYLYAMLEAGLLRPRRDGWQVDAGALSSLELPADVSHLLLRRVAELDELSQRVLSAFAVSGQRFELEVGFDYIDATPEEVAAAVGAAVDLRLVEHVRDDRYAFVHQEVRRALLDELTDADLRAVHQRIAEALDNPQADGDAHLFAVARHYGLGQVEKRRPRVYQTNLQAGLIALRNNAFEEAYEFLETARDFVDAAGQGEPTRLYRSLGEACAATGRVDEALQHFQAAIEGASTRLERARLRARIARVQMAVLEMEAAWEQIQAALAELDRSLPRSGVLRAIGSLMAWIFAWRAVRLPGAAPATASAEPTQLLAAQLYELGSITAFFRLDDDMMVSLVSRALRVARGLPDGAEKARVYATYAVMLAIVGKREAARDYAGRAIDIAETLGDRSVLASTRWFEATTYEFLGEARHAEELLRATIRDLGLWLELWEYVTACGELGALLLDRGFVREAGEWGRRILDRTEVGPDCTELVHMERVYGLYLVACAKAWAGDGIAAREYVERARVHLEGRQQVGLGEVSAVGYELAVHYECGNRGEDVDALLDRWAFFALTPETTPHQVRRAYIYQAYVRLDQYRWARDFDKRVARRRFMEALGDLGRAADNARFLTHLYAVRSEWEHLQGHEERAAALLSKAERCADEADSPWGSFEVGVRRARRLAARGNRSAALRHARSAHALAVEHGWKHRARDLRTEFDFYVQASMGSSTTSRSQGPSRSGSKGSTDAQSLKLQRYLESLLEVAIASGTVFDPQEQARVALDQIVRIFGAERAFLFGGPDAEQGIGGLEMIAGRDVRGQDIEDGGDYSSSVIDRVCAERRPVVSTGSDEGDVLASASAVHHNLRSIMAGPVQIRDHFLGVVYVDSRIARGVFAPDDAEILMAISSHIGIAQETARAAKLEVDIASERKKRELAEVIRQTTTAMTATLEQSEVLVRMLEGVKRVIDADRAVAFLLEDDRLELYVEYGQDGASVGNASEWVLGDPRIERVLETLRPQYSGQQDGLGGLVSEIDGETSWLGVPIVSRDELAGMMLLERDADSAYGQDDVQLALALAGQAGIAIQNARLFAQVEQLAVIDDLTQLPNRRRLFDVAEEEFKRARRYQTPLSVIMLDIDHFKQVNDTHGHAIGDEILREVGRRCVQTLRDTDTIGRYGGEEFVVITPQTTLDKACEFVAERLRAAVAQPPISTGAGDVRVTISLGVAELASFDETVDDLINRADEALYDAKEAGRNRVSTSQASSSD